ncbi:hypothetical protein [Streptomyces sp. AF1A]|jgi:hypothetical protein|uniref:hypothetical protein n=1 Tax=Streptomyces sp. AF1A TaxID=3394350 RepID=UPI0039BD6B5F
MSRLRKAAVGIALVGGISLMGIGPASAHAAGGGHGGGCKSHDFNMDLFGEVGLANGLFGNVLNGEGNPGAQFTSFGSECGGGW